MYKKDKTAFRMRHSKDTPGEYLYWTKLIQELLMATIHLNSIKIRKRKLMERIFNMDLGRLKNLSYPENLRPGK